MAAGSDLARACQLNAAYTEAHELDGHLKMMREDFPAAAASYALLLHRQTQDPLIASRALLRAVALYCAGDFKGAAEQAQLGVDLRPTDRMLLVFSALACTAAGLHDRAARQRAKAAQMPKSPSISGRHPVLPECQRDLSEALDRAYRAGVDLG
jgi:Flp pilus assembly protein TadD